MPGRPLLTRLLIDNKIDDNAGLQPSELSTFLGISRNTVSALLNGLEEQGLIERHRHPTDRRQFLIRLTPAGEELVYAHAPQHTAFVTSLFEELSPDERQQLLSLLTKLLQHMRHRALEAGINIPGGKPEMLANPSESTRK